MKWGKAIAEIESHEFSARLNVVSDMRSFFAVARNELAVQVLHEGMMESGEAREEVLGRIHDLSCLEIDRRFENPKDTPLAVLLWLTAFAAPDYVRTMADLVDRAPQCWYAKKLARRILMPSPVDSGNSLAGEPRNLLVSSEMWSGENVLTLNSAIQGAGRWHQLQPNFVASTSYPESERATLGEKGTLRLRVSRSTSVTSDMVMQSVR